MSRSPHRSPQADTHYRLPRETFGMLRIRRFSLTLFCGPCKSSTTINLVERPELAEVEVGSVDFACPRCSRICHYELQPPHQTKKRLLHEQAIGCRGPADYDPKPFVGPFPLLSGYEEQLIGDLAARGFCLLATCPGGRERLIDLRDADWHHLHSRRIDGLRLQCEGCRRRATFLAVPSWYRRNGLKVERVSWPPNLLPPRPLAPEPRTRHPLRGSPTF